MPTVDSRLRGAMDSPSPNRIESLVGALTAGKKDRAYRHARALLQDEPREEAVVALIEAMRRAVREVNRIAFERSTDLLAEWGGDAAAEALAEQARTQRRYPRLAINALALCKHRIVVPTLLDILAEGRRIEQRRAAAYALARIGDARAIEPLCGWAQRGAANIGPDAIEALRRMGRTVILARRVLAESALSTQDRARALTALAAVHPRRLEFWSFPFDPERFLEREAARRHSAVRVVARATADYLRQPATLLRAAEEPGPEALLRAASGPGTSRPDELLRPSEEREEETDDDPDPSDRPGLLRRLLHTLKGAWRR